LLKEFEAGAAVDADAVAEAAAAVRPTMNDDAALAQATGQASGFFAITVVAIAAMPLLQQKQK
jgi:hypothetical protein